MNLNKVTLLFTGALLMLLKGRYSIKQEIFYLGLLNSIVFFILIGAFFTFTLYDTAKESAERSLKGTNMETSAFIEGYFKEIINTLEVLAADPHIKNFLNGDEEAYRQALMNYRRFEDANENIAYIYSSYENGYLLINDYTPEKGYNPTERPWYKSAMEEKPDTSVGLPYREAITDELLISQSKALKDSRGNYSGVVAIDCSLDGLVALIGEKHLYDTQRTYVMEEDGNIIIHPDESYIGETFPQISEAITDHRGHLTYDLEERTVLGHYNTLEQSGWILVTAVDRQEIIQPLISQIRSSVLIAVILAFFLAMFQNRIFSRRFAEPIINLKERVFDITEGRPKTEASYSYSNHEIAMIAENIEQLAEHSLNKKNSELATIIESTADSILVVGYERKVIYVNTRFCEMWEIGQDLLVNASYDTFLNTAMEKLEDTEIFFKKMHDLFPSDKNETYVLNFKDGRVVEVFTCPLLEETEITGRLWSFRDVTDRKKAEDKLRHMATTDDLTGLGNRRHFMQAAEYEAERSLRYKQVFSLLMLDIDHFKRVNDAYGHAVGDEALKHLAVVIKKLLRRVEIPGRLGGEEFGIILPNTGRAEALIVAERLRSYIENNPVRVGENVIFFTVSIGLTDNSTGEKNVDEMLKDADKALYEAKAASRNRIVAVY